ncbi:sec-independent protein translocase protein TatA [Paracoccus chinensis]|uniref:Sec-independent protein translocase protein TatA n=1 Tax=Paracoccus chinensis TaxID=525640 RepID=A0A1G9DNE0_9RHOB|nr:sec-independent protein translocase protein TatA [Paracoccus chinensis]
MHAPSPMALLLIAIVVLVLFGRGKVSSLMGEVGKGITAFKRGVRDGAEEIERPVETPAERAAVTAEHTADDLELRAARARAEADRIQAEAEAARTRRADALRDVTPRDADRL